jgi:hypothetical protein
VVVYTLPAPGRMAPSGVVPRRPTLVVLCWVVCPSLSGEAEARAGG